MKVNEVRQVIENYSGEQLKTIIVELYKAIPKRAKEDRDIDALIKEAGSPKEKAKTAKERGGPADIEQLRVETEQFIDYAHKQYFLIPNNVVRKNDRPKWRFTAKRLFKELASPKTVESNLPVAAELLEKLYVLLCHSCGYTLFSAYDTFQSVGISQEDFFRRVLSLKLQNEKIREFIHNAIRLVIDNGLNRYTLYSTLLRVVVDYLKTPDMKRMAIEECDAIRTKIQQEPPSKRIGIIFSSHPLGDYEKRKKHRNLADMGFLCYASLYEYDEAVDYFKKHVAERDEEVALYVLLDWLFKFDLKDYWVREYQAAVDRGIKPREGLKKMYQYIQENGKLPDHMF